MARGLCRRRQSKSPVSTAPPTWSLSTRKVRRSCCRCTPTPPGATRTPTADRNITLALTHAPMGLAEADVELHTGRFRGRRNRAYPAEQALRIAMAGVGVNGAAQISLVA